MVQGASAIILKDKNILLVKRSGVGAYPYTWACAGGAANKGETPEEAVIREAKEEINIDFKPTKLFKKWHHDGRQFYRFLGNWKGNVKIQKEEITKCRWYSYGEAIKLDLGFDYREVIEILHKDGLLE
jgi:8-oxo-dGTP pyrophosphatase MutT (NUDIX family)